MKGKQLVILVAVAAVLVGAAILISRHEQDRAPAAVIGKEVLPGLDVNAVARIDVMTADAATTLARAHEIWTVPDLHGYPADFEKIRNLVLQLDDLTVGQVVPATAEDLATFHLLPPGTSGDAAATRVVLRKADGNELASLLIGDTRKSRPDERLAAYGPPGGYPDGQYVSPDGGASVYLVSDLLTHVAADPAQWVDTQLASVPAGDIAGITIRRPGADPLVLEKPEDANELILADLAEDETMDSSRTYNLKSALSYFRFANVADPALGKADTGLDEPVVFEAVTQDGDVYTVSIGNQTNEHYYVTLQAQAAQPAAPGAPETDAEPDAAAEPEAEDMGRAETTDAIAALNARHGRWTYLVASRQISSMTPERDELVKARETTEADTGTDAQTE